MKSRVKTVSCTRCLAQVPLTQALIDQGACYCSYRCHNMERKDALQKTFESKSQEEQKELFEDGQ